MNFTQTRGATPAYPAPGEVALEASVTLERATALIAASWAMAETFTGRNYWPVTAAQFTAEAGEAMELWWPRSPAPASVTVERLSGRQWVPDDGPMYDAPSGNLTFCAPGVRYRVTQVGTVTPAPGAHVVEGVRALALYQAIHSAARREFRQVQAGDTTMTREAMGGLFQASGAGIVLAGEVRW